MDGVVVVREILATLTRKGTRGFMGKVNFAKVCNSLD